MKAIKSKTSIRILCLVILAMFVCGLQMLNLTQVKALAANEPVFGNYYTSDFNTRAESLKAAKALNEEIYAEGVTLLKNEQNALPLGEGAKISLFGKNSNSIITGGSGSGSGGGGESVSLLTSLTDAGFSLNPGLVNFYNDNTRSGPGRGTAPSNGNVSPGYNTGETPVNMYTADVENTYADYSDAAVVVISRIGGEGFDLPRTMKWNGSDYGSWGNNVNQKVPGARNMDDHYLQLDENESNLLKYLGGKFEKVIVLLNTGSQFECGFLDDAGHYGYHQNIKAAMWIGYPGGTGIRSLGKILKGEISPSGKTVDTFARDFKKDPTWMNFGNNLMENGAANKGNQYANLPASGGNGGGGYRNNYVNYKEGIYVGYRYYETRGEEEGTEAYSGTINGTTNEAWDNWYNAHVVYPFGHGLSYTNFTQEIVSQTPAANSALGKDDTISITVKVKNTGNVAGKDVVQLYYTAPYTAGEIEKSHVVLGAFEKTGLLAPNEEQEVVLTMNVREMASYDWNDANKNRFKGYELDAGEGTYEVKVMRNSHEKIGSVKFTVAENIQYATSETTNNAIENRFDEVSNEITNYMSRKDFAGTFPTTDLKLTAKQWIIDALKEWDNRAASADESEPYYTTVMPKTGVNADIVLKDLIGKAYTDPLWETYLDQFTAEQLRDIARDGSYMSGQNISSLGVTRVHNADGPAGFIYGAPGGGYAFYCSETVLASTWNKDLAYEKGKAMGNEALWGDGTIGSRIPGWYAPAVNTHRSPFGGRNFEYYSEDGVLGGMLAAKVVLGAKDKGMFSYVKHFGLNDQETNRCGLLTWANEQSMREIYFKPFELTVKVGKTAGMMSGLNRIGAEWVGGSYDLLTNLLRKEWGFEGSVVTDSYMGDGSGLSNADQMVRAGGNLALGGSTINYNKDSATTITAIRTATHGILFAHANSMAMNTSSTPTTPEAIESFLGAVLKTGVVDAAYNETAATARVSKILYPDADDKDIVYSVSEGSLLPNGLTISEKGLISGIPGEELNNYSFSVDAEYKGFVKSATFTISIINPNGSLVYQMDQTLGFATIGTAYTASVAGAKIIKPDATPDEIEKLPPVSYALKNASLLPEGLTLSSAGEIVGTPTKECKNYQFTVVASAMGYKDKELAFTVSINNDLKFSGKTLKNGKLGISYVDSVEKAECVNKVTYALKEGSTLPSGLSLTKGGLITGTPMVSVTDHTFIVVASAAFAQDTESEYKMSIGLNYAEITVPDGKEGMEYDASVNTAQGASDITYALKEGSSMPDGLTISADGTIKGTPTKAGVYILTIVAGAEGKPGDETSVTLYIANAEAEDASGCGANIGIGFTSTVFPAFLAITTVLLLLRIGNRKKIKDIDKIKSIDKRS